VRIEFVNLARLATGVLVGAAVLYGQGVSPAAPQYDLARDGYAFLVREAEQHDFFLFGELHGDNEIPVLLERLWPDLWARGYRHAAAEMSPWAAKQLEFGFESGVQEIVSLWTKKQAEVIHAPASGRTGVIWGCDMEEIQPHLLIRDLAALNPRDESLRRMVEMVAQGYNRRMAPQLRALLTASRAVKDASPNGISLRENLLATLEIEKDRLEDKTRFSARNRREELMKRQFLAHYRAGVPGKVFLRFGQSHLIRGYDNERGVSTLGNFVAEFAIAEKATVFNVEAFGAGGTYRLNGKESSADQRDDEPAFAWLAAQAKYDATVFDMRPLRPALNAIESGKRSAVENSLTYWAGAYDALICYKHVTPIGAGH
jgi:hypothetical protein